MKQCGNSYGIGFADLLTIVFIVLKLIRKIDWSWWLVLLPTLIEIGIIALMLIGLIIYVLVDRHKSKKKSDN